jgi:OOP family OmpA-OmpF porin
MKNLLVAFVALAAGMAAVPAQSADNGIFLGGSVGAAGVKADDSFDGSNFDYDAGSTGYKLIAGWRFLDWLAVEADYVDLGSGDDKVQGIELETDINGVSLSALGFLPLGPVDLMARVGAIDWSADLRAPGFGSISDDGTDFTWGVGAQFRVSSLAIRAEYEQFDIADANTVDMISLGVTWTFL